MHCLLRPWGHMNYRLTGPMGGPGASPVLAFANSLGTDLRMWDDVTAALALAFPGMSFLGFDKRGHGLSATPDAPWDIADLSDDLTALLDHLGVAQAVIAGCSVGGMIAQDFAARRPERVTALILSNTAAQIGTAAAWQARIDAVRSQGIAAIAPAILERWFPAGFLATPEALPWATMLLRSDPAGYAETCAALSRADLTAGLAGIAAPTLAIAGGADLATPAPLVEATAARIAGCRFALLPGSGHLPAIDAPAETAALIATFLKETALG